MIDVLLSAARNREPVRLDDGTVVTLIAIQRTGKRGRYTRARVAPYGDNRRAYTIPLANIAELVSHDQLH